MSWRLRRKQLHRSNEESKTNGHNFVLFVLFVVHKLRLLSFASFLL